MAMMTLEDIQAAVARGVKFYKPGAKAKNMGRWPNPLDYEGVVISIMRYGGFDFLTEEPVPHVTVTLNTETGENSGLVHAEIPQGSPVMVRGLELHLAVPIELKEAG